MTTRNWSLPRWSAVGGGEVREQAYEVVFAAGRSERAQQTGEVVLAAGLVSDY
ncbi:hypothetical protein [Streptomyces avermitilis]|uniref:hypothetical protein n=1 Tax=Streptomyces avermitilis TaxID=33903 RepID=UPI003813BEDD